MNTANQASFLSRSFVGRVAPAVSPEVRQMVNLSRSQGWNCPVLGQAPLPSRPVRLGDWLIAPVHQDSSTIPTRALERVQAIYRAGLRPRGFVVVHEAPKLLPTPAQERQPSQLPLAAVPRQTGFALKVIGIALAAVSAVVVAVTGLAVLALAVVSLAAILMIPAFLVVGVAVIDPILVAVTHDGYWIEIDRWWN